VGSSTISGPLGGEWTTIRPLISLQATSQGTLADRLILATADGNVENIGDCADRSNGNTPTRGLTDTMWDLIVDALGAAAMSLIGWRYIKGCPQRSD
jgi:hypothetical protein